MPSSRWVAKDGSRVALLMEDVFEGSAEARRKVEPHSRHTLNKLAAHFQHTLYTLSFHSVHTLDAL